MDGNIRFMDNISKTEIPIGVVASATSTRVLEALTQLREDIISGILKPGEKLRVQHLKSKYGVGAATLRESSIIRRVRTSWRSIVTETGNFSRVDQQLLPVYRKLPLMDDKVQQVQFEQGFVCVLKAKDVDSERRCSHSGCRAGCRSGRPSSGCYRYRRMNHRGKRVWSLSVQPTHCRHWER